MKNLFFSKTFIYLVSFQLNAQSSWDQLDVNYQSLMLESKTEKAIKIAEKQVEIAHSSETSSYLKPLSYSNLAGAHLQAKNFELAKINYKQAIEFGKVFLDTSNSKLFKSDLNGLAIAHSRLGHTDTAMTIFRNVLSRLSFRDSSFKKQVHLNMIDLFKRLQNETMVNNLRAEFNLAADTSCDCNKEKELSTIHSEDSKEFHPTKSEESKFHIVQKNENLYALSRKYNTSVEKLIFLNKLSSYKIVVGQKLQVKK